MSVSLNKPKSDSVSLKKPDSAAAAPGGNSSQPQQPQDPQSGSSYQQQPQGPSPTLPQPSNPPQPGGQPGPVDLKTQCMSTIKTFAIIAAAIAFVPLPVGDSVAIIIAQVIMVSTLCGRYSRPMGGSVILIIISAMLGPLVFSILLDIIPVLGWAIAAAVSYFFTFYVGSITHSLLQENKAFTFRNFIDGFHSNRASKRKP